NSIRIPLSIWKQNGKIVGTNALIDSGATGCFISRHVVEKMGLPTWKLDNPVQAWNVDGTPNQSGTIKESTKVVLDYRGIREQQDLYVLNCG
ncbi:hypothetical protein J3R82DRAFT_9513, partial [Butyriboletus roseoflavus]